MTTNFKLLSFTCIIHSLIFVLFFTWYNNALKICIKKNKRCNQLLMITLKFRLNLNLFK